MTTTATPINLNTRSTRKQKNRVRRTQAQWKALLEEYTNSGLTQAAFCQQYRIAPSGLCKWRKHFARQPVTSDFVDITESLAQAPSPLEDSGVGKHWQVELELSPGVILRVRTV